jgi:hypothetical protein
MYTLSSIINAASSTIDHYLLYHHSTEPDGGRDDTFGILSVVRLSVHSTASEVDFEKHEIIVWNDAMRRVRYQGCYEVVVHRE